MCASIDAPVADLANFSLFTGLSSVELQVIAAQTSSVELPAAQFVALEGEEPEHIFLIRHGQVEIVKNAAPDPTQAHRVAILEKGDSVGEMALLDYQSRSASARTLAPSTFYVLSLAQLRGLQESHNYIYRIIVNNVESEVCRRLRYTTEVTVVSLRETLEQAKIRALMGHFLTNIFVILCFYALIAGSIASMILESSTSVFISASLLVGILVPATLIVVKRGRRSLSFFGLTASNWRSAVRDALTWTFPILALAVTAKWITIQHPTFSHLEVFSGRLAQNPTHGPYLLQLGIYIALVPSKNFWPAESCKDRSRNF